jgi:hypothetical protein
VSGYFWQLAASFLDSCISKCLSYTGTIPLIEFISQVQEDMQDGQRTDTKIACSELYRLIMRDKYVRMTRQTRAVADWTTSELSL